MRVTLKILNNCSIVSCKNMNLYKYFYGGITIVDISEIFVLRERRELCSRMGLD